MEIKYEIKGVTLDVCDLVKIHKYYEVACTTEYILENYNVTEEEASKLAVEIREYMDDRDVTESEAICEVISKYGCKC